eukprot:m.245262 g.245262  ORF g.245262 m.245262 type:complete len:335 (+) comp36091_c0_seq1:29-1033(+)
MVGQRLHSWKEGGRRVCFSLTLLALLAAFWAPAEAVTTPTPRPCAGVANCNNCSTTVPTQCGVCANSQYLLEGACVASCPAGFTPVGTGRFSRVCSRNFACTALRDSCFLCNTNRSACLTCAHSKYLSQGSCVSACPDGSYGRGTGRFHRVCIPDPKTPCTNRRNGCFLCDPSNTRCLTCTRGKVLFEGRCIDRAACPAITHSVRGTGQFRLRCLPVNITANTTCTTANCFSCPTDVSVCEDCVPKNVLNNNQCVSSCSPSSIRMQGFGAAHVCVPSPVRPSTCQPRANNCLACSDDTCIMCDGSRTLFQGVCLEACPTHTLETVSATTGRRCT